MTLFRENHDAELDLMPAETPAAPARRKARGRAQPLSLAALQHQDDARLVALAQQGETRAFDVLTRRHQQMVLSSLMRMMDLADAQDVAQDAFIKAYRSIGNFRGDSQFATWLYRIASNTAMNHLKMRRRHAGSLHLDALEGDKIGIADRLVDHDTPEDHVVAEQLQQVLEQRLQRMKPDLREAITCYELDGMSYQEIAERMDCPVGTIRSRISRSREVIDQGLRLHGYAPLSADYGA